MKTDYHKEGEYLLPNLMVENEKKANIGKYGLMRLEYLKEYKKPLYTQLLMKNKLQEHLIDIDEACRNRFYCIMEDYIKNDERLSETSKENNSLDWIMLMENYKNTAEYIVLNEIVFI